MAANQEYETDDEMDSSDNAPKFPENFEGLLEVISMDEMTVGEDEAQSCGTVFKVLESNTQEAPVGAKRFYLIYGLDNPNPKKRKLKKQNVRRMLAPMFGYDQTDETQKWSQIYRLCVDKGLCIGKKVRVKTGAMKKTGKGEYLPFTFFIA